MASYSCRGAADGADDALVAAAAADVALHPLEDLLVAGAGRCRQQRGRLHDLAGLAEAALRHVHVAPGDLDRVVAVGRQAFDGGEGGALRVRPRALAAPHRLAVEVHGAGAAEPGAAAVLGAGEAELVPEVRSEEHTSNSSH